MATDKVVVDIITNADKSNRDMLKFAAGVGVAAAAVAGLYAIGKDLVAAYAVQEQAEARLAQTIKSTGGAAGLSADQLKRMATELQGVTKFGDEAIIGAESLLLTFKDIGEDVFPRALESILDVSEAMGQDLQSSTIQLGKALNDPIGGISALTRVGIQFSDEQKEMIKVMTEAGDVAGAQGIILEELESQFGGVARAAADTATGSFVQFQNAMGDVKESLGGVLAEAFSPLAEKLTDIALAIANTVNDSKELSDAFKALENGTATADQKLVALTTQLVQTREAQAKATAINRSYADNFTETIKKLEDDIALEKQRIRYLAMESELGKKAAEAEQERTTSIADNNVVVAESNELAEQEIDLLQQRIDQIVTDSEIERGLREADMALDALIAEQKKDNAEQEKEDIKELIDLRFQYADAAMGILSAVDSYSDAVAKAELQRMEDAGASEEELNKKKKQFAKENAQREKALGILSATVDTAAAIIGFLADPGGIPGLALSAAAAVTGAIQIGAINAAPIPAFATGGDFVTNGPGMIMVGDNPGGRERVTVTPEGSANLGGGGGTNRLIIEIQPRGLVKPMQTLIDNQEIIIR